MTIGFATVSPYPSLTPAEAKSYSRYDYSIQTTMLQTKRYTMADINKLSKRIQNLEYYTSLSLLEQSTNSLLVRSDSTGQNRFKNGILVDPFKDHSIGNTNDGTYNISIDRISAEARPSFNQITTGLEFDSSTSTAVKAGDLILLPYTANNLNQSQQFASKYRNCIEGNIYNYRGTMVLNPPGITSSDLQQRPLINGSIDNYTNFVGGGRNSKYGTEWGNWYGFLPPASNLDQINLTASSQSADNFRTTTTSTLTQMQMQAGRSFTSPSSDTSVNNGEYTTDVAIQSFVPTTDVYFFAKGMKPSTNLYAYFDDINVSVYSLNLTPYVGSWTQSGGNLIATNGSYVYVAYDGTVYSHNNGWGGQLISDVYGNVYGIFKIPSGLFKSGQLEFRLADISDLTIGESAITTQASYSMFCSPLSVQKQKNAPTPTVRPPQVDTGGGTVTIPGGGSAPSGGGGVLKPPQEPVKEPERKPWLPPFAVTESGLIPLDPATNLYIPLPTPPLPVVPVDTICALPLTPSGQPDPVQPPVVAIEPAAPDTVWLVNGENGDGTLIYIEVGLDQFPPPDEYIFYSYGD
jgi:hypothetical protein